MEVFDYMYVRPATFGGGFDVMGVSTHPDDSVLAGQECVCFVDTLESVAARETKYPQCKDDFRNKLSEPRNSYAHLPNNGDGW